VRLLLLADTLPNGGLERQLALLAANLPGNWEARVWAMDEGPFLRPLLDLGIPVLVRRRRSQHDIGPALQLLHDVTAWRPDVVHAWGWMSALAAVPACRALGIPCINGMIRSGALESRLTVLKRFGLAGATLVVANTQAGLDAWSVRPAKARLVHNGFDQSRLEALTRTAPDDSATFTVVMTARMTRVKQFDLVIEAARRLAAEDAGWRFLLVGSGPDRDRLIGLAADLVEQGVVFFPTSGMEVMGLLSRADAGVLMTDPTRAREGLSNSILEYMAAGLPVVCGDGGGNPEVVLNGVTGYVIPQGDLEALVDRLGHLRRHPEIRASMGAAGKERVLTEFSVETMVDRMLAVYAEAMAATRRRHALCCRRTLRDQDDRRTTRGPK
jgi:glycosyltransferase involved in cell wall biosynthesis